jgi:hypothetical protein
MINRTVVFSFVLACAAGWLCGCLSNASEPFKEWQADEHYNEFVPDTAKPVASGTGVLTFTAPERGTLYLLDTTDRVKIKEAQFPRGIASGLLNKGDKVTFDPAKKRAWKEGGEGVGFTKIDPTHTHEFRFDPNEKKKEG